MDIQHFVYCQPVHDWAKLTKIQSWLEVGDSMMQKKKKK